MNQGLGKVPLERALSKLGVASRRQTQEYVHSGRLKVNGKVVKDPWFPVTPETDVFELDGRIVSRSAWCTLMLYKPRGVVTTRSDEKGRATVFDLLPAQYRHLHPVGRLDMASSGLLLLTSDTRLSDYLTDPANAILRKYVVTVEGKVDDEEIVQILSGIEDEGELLKPTGLILLKASHKESHLIVELDEGKNREIRRIFGIFNRRVRKLKRIAFGALELGDLESGKFREMRPEEFSWIPMMNKKQAGQG